MTVSPTAAITPFTRLALLLARRRRVVLGLSLLLFVGGLALAPTFQSKLLGIGYEVDGTESHAATELLREATGFTERDVLVVASAGHRYGEPDFDRGLAAALATVRHAAPDAAVRGPGQRAGGAISQDRLVATATVSLTGSVAERQKTAARIGDALDEQLPSGTRAAVTGDSPFLVDLIAAEKHDIVRSEMVGLPVAMLILLVAFGSVVAGVLPLLLAVVGVTATVGLLTGMMFFEDFNAFAESLMVMIGIAVGIDYSLLIVRRFREERAHHDDVDAIARTLNTAGRTVLFSGAILATSLSPLLVVGPASLAQSALAMITVVAVAVALALTFLPALLLSLGDRLERLSLPWRGRSAQDETADQGRWYGWARGVMRRPAIVLGGGTALLLLAASPVLGLKTGVDLNTRALADRPSVEALQSLADHLPSAATRPVQIVVHGPPGRISDATRAMQNLMRQDRRLRDVSVAPLRPGLAVVRATSTVGVDTLEAKRLIGDLRAKAGPLGGGTEALVTGITAQTVDYSSTIDDATPYVVGGALLLAFVLLLVLFRSPLLALKAIVMNLLSIGAAFGLTVLVFQHGLGEHVLDFSSPGFLQSWFPLNLFVIVFGLSMDYEVFMVSRIREERDRGRSTEEAVAVGLQRTGSVVTYAAAIMVVVFASFTLGSIPELKQTGFGLAAAVLIDATIVRAMLVPAFIRLAGPWSWWIPTWLDQRLPRLGH